MCINFMRFVNIYIYLVLCLVREFYSRLDCFFVDYIVVSSLLGLYNLIMNVLLC